MPLIIIIIFINRQQAPSFKDCQNIYIYIDRYEGVPVTYWPQDINS